MKNLGAVMSIFNSAGIDTRADFHTLTSSQVEAILEAAKESGYRKPKNASGSTARYFFQAVARAWARERK
jgi:hypothetical protein